VIVTRITAVAGVFLLAGLVWLAAVGFTPALVLLGTGFALVALVGLGSWFGGRGGPQRSRAAPRGDAGEEP